MFERQKFQAGSLTKEERKRQPDLWIFRWHETTAEGQRVRRKIVVRTVEQYHTESLARKALAALKIDTNPNPSQGSQPVFLIMGQLIWHYDEHELGPGRYSKTENTVEVYRDYLRLYIEPRWGKIRLRK